MTTVEFSDTEGNQVGTITVTDTGDLSADPWLESVAASWRAQGRSGAEFVKHYDGWSNGQVIARIRGEENTPMADIPKLGSGARFKKLTAKLAAKGKAPDAQAAAGRKKPSRFARLAAKKQQSE